MVVEPHPRMQEVFRQAFADSGYQVLLMSDADRAVQNLQNDPGGVDMVVFYASAIGRPAVDAFNRLADDPNTADIPAVLLLGKHQSDWHADARRARIARQCPHRYEFVSCASWWRGYWPAKRRRLADVADFLRRLDQFNANPTRLEQPVERTKPQLAVPDEAAFVAHLAQFVAVVSPAAEQPARPCAAEAIFRR